MPSDKATVVEIPVNVLKNNETCLFELTELRILTRKKEPSNETLVLRKSTNIGLWVVGTPNQFFIRGS